MREFGDRDPTARYVLRPSAYGILARADGRIAVLRTPLGVFLPGGGREPDESDAQTVARETMEECGMRVQVGRLVGRATEFIHARSEATYFEIPSAFFEATAVSGGHPSTEPDHVLEWMDRVVAMGCMVRASHAWALGESAS